ncbi:adenylate kinase [Thalassomonas sp. RHCl1]|uniref:adenylate kinase n=1 Tax=Thalassomonas sp. RHCl1 TaxID=2995320 RepID=UPI00248C6C95|nr:adenylate kinase [Thalassomonas sp. RHCl1]
MKKVAVFGNAGAGKSTTSKQIAAITGLELYALDKVKFLPGGDEVPHDQYLAAHSRILSEDKWLIEGYGCLDSTWTRLNQADTLVYIDLPVRVHFFWVTKRFFKGLFQPPEGWPERSSIIKGTINSYRVLWLCHKKLTPAYRKYVANAAKTKTVYHLRSKADIASFLHTLGENSG